MRIELTPGFKLEQISNLPQRHHTSAYVSHSLKRPKPLPDNSWNKFGPSVPYRPHKPQRRKDKAHNKVQKVATLFRNLHTCLPWSFRSWCLLQLVWFSFFVSIISLASFSLKSKRIRSTPLRFLVRFAVRLISSELCRPGVLPPRRIRLQKQKSRESNSRRVLNRTRFRDECSEPTSA